MRRPRDETAVEWLICQQLRTLRLRKFREAYDQGYGCKGNPYTQVAVARAADVQQARMTMWESERPEFPCSIERFDRWCRYLGTTFIQQLAVATKEQHPGRGEAIKRALEAAR
jgi:hypothetical protein